VTHSIVTHSVLTHSIVTHSILSHSILKDSIVTQSIGTLDILLQMCHHHSKIWFYVSLCAIILFFPLAIPGAVFAHKARQDAKRGDKLAYVKHLRISRVLTGIAIGFGISCIANVTARVSFHENQQNTGRRVLIKVNYVKQCNKYFDRTLIN